jgi:hypothetical protein
MDKVSEQLDSVILLSITLGITKYYESFSFARFEVLTDVLDITGVIWHTRRSGLGINIKVLEYLKSSI